MRLDHSVTEKYRRVPCTERQQLSAIIFGRCRYAPCMVRDHTVARRRRNAHRLHIQIIVAYDERSKPVINVLPLVLSFCYRQFTKTHVRLRCQKYSLALPDASASRENTGTTTTERPGTVHK